MTPVAFRILKKVARRGELSLSSAIQFAKKSGGGDHIDQYPLALLIEEQPIIDILRRSSNSAFLWERIEQLFNPYGIDDWPAAAEPISTSKEQDRPEFIAAKRVLLRCEWFRIYDLIEYLFEQLDFHDTELRNADEEFQAYPFQRNINDYFEYAGIGWKLAGGKIVARGDDAFERTVQTAEVELENGGRTTAADCIEDAIRNLSFRPKARLGAAVARATNAMECVLHDITGEEKIDIRRLPSALPRSVSRWACQDLRRPLGLRIKRRRAARQRRCRAAARRGGIHRRHCRLTNHIPKPKTSPRISNGPRAAR